jgi:hypothetical protein
MKGFHGGRARVCALLLTFGNVPVNLLNDFCSRWTLLALKEKGRAPKEYGLAPIMN